ncbi:hypothetical protein B0H13DRAFT_1194423 [Mycena leptocephala]|nr:hypothetical protein B0H13DRAFT_1194423 [Mycena leptocephala]
MSVEEIQARIAQLSVDIEVQKELLRQLETSKSAAQRQLNAIRDPVARLPFEISSEIFLQCLPFHHPGPTPGARSAPMLLLNVCNAWTHIVLSTPALWDSINLEFPGVEILQLWLERAQHRTLSISLHRSLSNGVAAILRKYAEQIKQLELYEEESDVDSWSSHLPCLEILTIGSPDYDPEAFYVLGLPPIMGLLSLAPNLVECTFFNISIDLSMATESKMILPGLRCLKFGVLGPLAHGGDDILLHISLPALEELVVPLYDLTPSGLLLFLEQSLPPLRRLALGSEYRDIEFIELDEWLRLVPALTDLELFTEHSIFADDLFSTLADSPSGFLPNLRSLKIQHQSSALSPSSYQSLLRALSTRHTRLSCFHLQALRQDEPKPPADVCDGLRQLVADGMEIYVGNRRENYVSL